MESPFGRNTFSGFRKKNALDLVICETLKSLDSSNVVLPDLLKYPCLIAASVISAFPNESQVFGEGIPTMGAKEPASDKAEIAGFPTDG